MSTSASVVLSSSPSHAFVPHLWKQGACRECTRSQAEHTATATATGNGAGAAATARATTTKPATAAPVSPPPSRPVPPVAASAAVAPAPAAAPVGRVAALAKRAEVIQPAAPASASAPALTGPPGVALKTQPTATSASAASQPPGVTLKTQSAAASPALAEQPPASKQPPSLLSTVGTAMTVAAAATAFRRPLVAKLPPPLPSVIAAGANSNATTAATAASMAPAAAKHAPPPPLPLTVLPVPDRPVPPLPSPSSSPTTASAAVTATTRATSPIPDRPVPPLPAASAAAAALASSARASPTSLAAAPAASSPATSPTNCSSATASNLAGMPPPPTRKPPAPPNRAPPKAPSTPVAAATVSAPAEPPSPAAADSVPVAVEPLSPASAEPTPTIRLVRAGSVGAGPPRLPPPLSSVVPAAAVPAASVAASVPPVPFSAAAATASAVTAPTPARVPPPLHAVVAASVSAGPPPPPPVSGSSSAVPPPLHAAAAAAAAASVAPPPATTTAAAVPQQRFPPPPPPLQQLPQQQPQSSLSAEAEAPSLSVASFPPPPPPPRGPPPLNLPPTAAAAATASAGPGPPPLPAAVKSASSSALPPLQLNSGTAATRLVDYFCVFGRGALCLDALDGPDFPPSSSAYPDALAASAAAWASLRFQPVLLPSQRYPAFDHRDSALSGNTASFAFPSYIALQLCPQREVDDPYAPSWVARRPRMHRFTLTKLDGTKQFCSSLTFYERVADAQIEGLLAEIEAALRGRILKSSAQAKDIDIEAFMIELRNGACGRTITASVQPPALPPSIATNGRPPPPPPSLSRTLPPACALFVPKSLTVVSSWPFFSLWEEMLKALFRTSHVGLSQASIRKFAVPIATNRAGASRGAEAAATTAVGSIEKHPESYSVLSLPLPLERLLVNFLCEIPVPPPGVLQVRFHLPPGSWLTTNTGGSDGSSGGGSGSDSAALLISRPPLNQLPLCDINWHLLFRAVAPEAFVAIFTAVATEQKVLLVSRHANLITAVCDAVAVLLFPLAWQGVFMPLLPEPMLEFLYAPVPFIAGIDADCFARHFDSATGDIDLPEELVLVELDALPTARIRIPADDSIPQLPERIYSKLLAQLKEHAGIHNPTHPFVRISDQAFPFGQEQDRVEMSSAAAAAMAARTAEQKRSAATATDPEAPGSHTNGVGVGDRTPPPPLPQPLVPASYQALSTAFEPVQTYIPIPQAVHAQQPSSQTMQRRGSYPPPSRGAAGSISGGGVGTAISPSSGASLDSPALPVAGPSPSTLSGTSAALDRGVELNVEQVREAFLRLWCKLLKSYNKFMPWGVHASPAPANAAASNTPSSNGTGGSASPPGSPTLGPAASPSGGGGGGDVWFNTAGFLAHAPRDARPFLTQLCRSQLFAKFVDDRILVRADIEAWQASPAHPAFQAQQGSAKAGGRKRAGGGHAPAPLRPSSPSAFSTTSTFSPYSATTTPSHRSRASNLSSGGGGGHADDSDNSDHEGDGAQRQQHHNHNEEDEPDEYAAAEPSQSPQHHSKTRSVSSMGFASRSGFHSRQSSTLDASTGGDDEGYPPSTVCPPSFLSAQLDARDPTVMPILAQVQFFDECVLAQKNRRISKGVRGVLHKASDFFPTPFLHDTSHLVSRVEDTLRPSLEGLPAQPLEYGYPVLRSTAVALPSKSAPQGLQAATAVYPVFPALDPALFGQPRPIPMLATERDAAAAAAAAEAAAEDEIAPELRFHFTLPPPLPPSATSNGSKADDPNRAVRFAVDDSPPSSPRSSQPAPGASHPDYVRATPASLRTSHRGSFIAFRARAPSGMQSHIAELANVLSFETFSGAGAGTAGNRNRGPPPVPSAYTTAAAAVSPASSSSSSYPASTSSAPVAIGNKTLHKLMEKERLKQEKARKKAAQAAQRKDKDEAAAQAQQQQQQAKKKHVTWTPPVYSSSQSVQSATAAASKATSSPADPSGPSSTLVRSGTVIGRGRAGSSIFSFQESGRIEPVNSTSGGSNTGGHGGQASSTKSVSFAAGPASASGGGGSGVHAHASTPKSQPSSSKGALVKTKFGTMQSPLVSQQPQPTQPPPPPVPPQQQQGHDISRPVMLPVEAMPSVMQAQAQAAAAAAQQKQTTPPPLPAGAVTSPSVLPPPLPAGVGASSASGSAAAAATVSPPRLPPPLVSPPSVLPPPLPSSASGSALESAATASGRPLPPPRRMSTIAPPPLPSSTANAATVQPRKPPPPLR